MVLVKESVVSFHCTNNLTRKNTSGTQIELIVVHLIHAPSRQFAPVVLICFKKNNDIFFIFVPELQRFY